MVALATMACDASAATGANAGAVSAPAPASLARAQTTAAPVQRATPPPVSSSVSLTEAEQVSLALLNQLRSNRGLGSVRPAADLTNFARNWSRDLSANGFRHAPQSEARKLLVNGRTGYGENIVYTSDTRLSPTEVAEMFHDLWVNSPGHYANMTQGRFTQVGVGIVRTSSGWYGTHSFTNG